MTTAYRIDTKSQTIQTVEIDVRNGFEALEDSIASPKIEKLAVSENLVALVDECDFWGEVPAYAMIDGIGHVAGTFFIAGANSDGDIEDINVSIEDVAAKISAFQVLANARERPGQKKRHFDFAMAISDPIKLKIIEDDA